MKICDRIRAYKKQQLAYTGDEILATQRISWGVFILDLITGGIPKGRFTEVYGAKSSSKTTTLLRAAGLYLTNNPNNSVLFIDHEKALEKPWMKHFIKDLKRFYVFVPDHGNQAVDAMEELAQSDDLGLIINDSIAAMTPLGEIATESSLDDTMGLQTKLVNKMIRKLTHIMTVRRKTGNLLTVVNINQLRSNFKAGKFGSPTTTPGGMMREFANSMEIQLYTKKYHKVRGVPINSQHTFTLQKNKLGLAKRSGEFVVNLVETDPNYPVGSISEKETILVYAKRAGLVVNTGKGWSMLGKMYRIGEDLEQALTDIKLLSQLRKETLAVCLNDVLLTSDEKDSKEEE